jgi:hypothetical protein
MSPEELDLQMLDFQLSRLFQRFTSLVRCNSSARRPRANRQFQAIRFRPLSTP